MRLSPSVRAVQVPEGDPRHPQYTSIYLAGEGQTLTIDSGDRDDRYRWMLKGYLGSLEHTEIGLALLTHHHLDHSANLAWLTYEFGCEAVVPQQAAALLGQRLPATGVRTVSDGDNIEVHGGLRLRTIATPGHSADSVCYYLEDEGVLFTGDTILGGASTTVEDLGAYLQSLERLRRLPNLLLICPGHGRVINAPLAYIDAYIEHRQQRERQILALLQQTPQQTAAELLGAVYGELDERLQPLAQTNLRGHIEKLLGEGRVRVIEDAEARYELA